MSYTGNEVINGLFGIVIDETGAQLQSTQEAELVEEFEKVDLKIPGKRRSSAKVMGSKVTGKLVLDHVDSRLQKKIADSPTQKFNYIMKLEDPDAKGSEAVLVKGLSFDSNPVMGFKMGEKGEKEFPFTADDYEFTEWIE